MLLAIDTATQIASLALHDGGRLWAEETWQSANKHTVELMPAIVRTCERAGVVPEALSAVAVSIGPGSFTGLRIGISVAKGLALARSIPLVGVPTLDVVACPHYDQRLPICAVIQAGRGKLCVGFYRKKRGRWYRAGDHKLATLPELVTRIEGKTLFCGELGPEEAEYLTQHLAEQAILASPASSLRRAGFLAELAWERLCQDDHDDPATLSPIYLHKPPPGAGAER